jgi:glycosyltransferase involved in cell wall biosynthesis
MASIQRGRGRLRIAMLGSRGIPASYSGFETCVEQLSTRLVERGHEVTVYCRSHHITWPDPTYKGVRLVKLPTIASKHLDTIIHTFLSMLHALPCRYDVIYVCGVGNAPLVLIPRLAGVPTIVNVDGADWQREKWGRAAKEYLRFAERAATRLPTCIIADSHVVERYYQQCYQAPSVFIPYGSEVPRLPHGATLERLGLRPDGYILWVGRLVPENNAHHLVEAYRQLGGSATGLQLCIVGDAPYSEEYVARLKAMAGPGVVFTGYVFGAGYHELGSNARLFVFTSGVGGTHPALLEAMAFGNAIVANDAAANRETLDDAGTLYPGAEEASGLARVLRTLLPARETAAGDVDTAADAVATARIGDLRQRAAARAANVYTWSAVTDAYEALFFRLADARCGSMLAAASLRDRSEAYGSPEG